MAGNIHIGTFELTRDGSMQEAWREVPVQVKMGLDADGVIQAEVRDVQSGKTKAITLNRHG